MDIRFPSDGGVLLAADEEELRDLIECLQLAADEGEASGQLLTDTGVETVTIRRLEAA